MDDLTAQAGLWGVVNGYHDVFGRWHEASAETQRLARRGAVARARPAARDCAGRRSDPRISGRWPPVLGAGGSTLRAALAAQLGAWRFQRSRAAHRARGGARRRRHRAQSAACPVPRSRAGGEPLCAEQPHLHQSALHRRRRHSGISRRRGGRHRSRSAARRRADRLRRRGARQARCPASCLRAFRDVCGRGSSRGVRALPGRAGRAAFALFMF